VLASLVPAGSATGAAQPRSVAVMQLNRKRVEGSARLPPPIRRTYHVLPDTLFEGGSFCLA
jgi:hypothetical protein